MTFEESIGALGLSERLAAREKGPITESELRAAYVALIKVHKPERDPEGFRRVREAYDQAQQGLRWHTLLAGSPGGDTGFESPAFSSPFEAPSAAANKEERPDASAPVGDATQAEPPVDDRAIDAAYQAIDEAKDDASRIAVLRKAIADFPREGSFRWQLIDVYDATQEAARADALIQEGIDLNLTGFLETHAHQAPESITKEQLERLRKSHATLIVLRVAIAQKLEPLLRETLQSAMELGHSKQPRMPYIDLALFALERHDAASAGLVLDAVKEHDALFALEPRSQVAEVFTRDLRALCNDIPRTFFGAFIQGVRLGRPNHEVSALAAANPEQARRILTTLKRHSAALARAYEPLLSAEPETAPAPAKSNWHWGWLLLASGLVRACMAANRNAGSHTTSSYELQRALDRAEQDQRWRDPGSSSPAEDPYARAENASLPIPTSTELETAPSTTTTPEEVHAAVIVICQEANAHCRAAEELEQSIQEGRCELSAAIHFAQSSHDQTPAVEFRTVRDAALHLCALDTSPHP